MFGKFFSFQCLHFFQKKKIESNRYQGSVYGTLLPSVRSSESSVGIRSYHVSDPLLVFAAVKKMAPSPREATGPEVPDERPFSAPSPRGATVQKFQMHAHSLESPGVGYCATNEVVQFFFCCGTFKLQFRSECRMRHE